MSTTATLPLQTNKNVLQIFAVILLGVIGAGAFVLSFKALREVWIGIGADPITSFVFPVIIDGPILAATVAIVFLSSFEGRGGDKFYSWMVLFLFSGVSVWLNAIHVTLSEERKFEMITSAIISAMPPIALMLTIHLIAILIHRAKKKSGTLNKTINKEGDVVSGAKKKTDAQILGFVRRHIAKGRIVTNADMMKWTGSPNPQSASHILRRLRQSNPESFEGEPGTSTGSTAAIESGTEN